MSNKRDKPRVVTDHSTVEANGEEADVEPAR